MNIQDDETLRLYVEESIEHLADIENDLLAIESAGADIDEELVNKVFRAAHSIKGGAGFMGLNNIKELSHKMENVLGMIREREMAPNPEIVNILLLASDALRNLLSTVESSNDINISEHIDALVMLTDGLSVEESSNAAPSQVNIEFPEGKAVFHVAGADIDNARKTGNFIYLVEFDLIQDAQDKGRTPEELLGQMAESGVVIDCSIDISAVGDLDSEIISNTMPFFVLFATILEPDMINAIFEVDDTRIFVLSEDLNVSSILEEIPADGIEEGKAIIPGEAVPGEKPDIDVNEFQSGAEDITLAADKDTGQKEKSAVAKISGDASLRVSVSLLDSLMDLAGELVLGRNQLLQSITLKDPHNIDASGQRLDLITSELQEAIMMTRMQPIGNVLSKFPRVVRDLARNLGKEVNLTIEGEGVELDKTILEAINDPLTHLVRNSVDHGIEIPDERRNAGKESTGQVLLKAYHEAGQVNIEIKDDGKGIDPNKLAAAAKAKNLVSEKQILTMSEKDKVNLIFLPGFSTAEIVSDVSGRGVGMDVVKTNLDKLGGVVEIDSVLGEGTSIKIKLPLTLAIIPSQIITTGNERYAIPQVNLEELFRIPAAQVKERIERVGDAEVVRLRGNLLPLIRLADIIGIERTYVDPSDNSIKADRRELIADRRSRVSPLSEEVGQEDGGSNGNGGSPETDTENKRHGAEDRRYHATSAINIVVVYTGALKYGLVVDELHDSEEIVVKPLGRHLKHCGGYAGATIMGDGRVALILDVAGISQMAGLTSLDATDRALDIAREHQLSAQKDIQSMLIFRNAEDEQFAVPLGLVERVEKIKRSNIEMVGGKKVIQYRGASLPLFAIEEVADVKPMAEKEDILVVVFVIAGRDVGLLATPPLDAIEKSLVIDDSTLKQPGIMGSSIVEGHTTLIVDIYDIVETLNPEWFKDREVIKSSAPGDETTVLYAEDSNFFRNQVKGYLEEDGYKVLEAEDGVIAWNMMQKYSSEISLVITDIEMPNMDGFKFVKKIRGDNRFSGVPVIALTTMASDEDVDRGVSVGINDYQVKLDKDKLMESVNSYLRGA